MLVQNVFHHYIWSFISCIWVQGAELLYFNLPAGLMTVVVSHCLLYFNYVFADSCTEKGG